MNSITPMPRPQRIEFANAWYHVLNVSEVPVFNRASTNQRFLEVLQETATIYNVAIHAFCLQKNRYDLLISTPLGNLSTAMRHINSVFTQDFQRLHDADGGVFKGRFKAVLIDAKKYAMPVSRYIHRLPARWSRHRWSSLGCYTGGQCIAPFLDAKSVFTIAGVKVNKRSYERYMDEGIDAELEHFYSRKNLRSVLADNEFLSQKTSRTNGSKQPKKLQLKKIANVTADHFKVDFKSLFDSMRGPTGGNIPRAVSMLISREVGHYTLKEIADFYNVEDVSTVSVTIKRLKSKSKEQHTLVRRIEKLKNRFEYISSPKKKKSTRKNL